MREQLKNGFLLVCSVVLVLLMLELALALFWPHKVTFHPYQAEHCQYDEFLGWVNKPDLDGFVKVSDRIAFHRRHNSKGMRSLRETGYEKLAGVKRVLVLGDSFTWGFGVDDQQVLTHLLQQKTGSGIEILNGSVVGYGTDQEFLWLEREGLRYLPDLVVLAFYVGNDYEEVSQSLSYGYPKPYFDIDEQGLLLGNVPVPDTRETRRKGFDKPSSMFGRFKKFLRYNTHTYPFLAGRLNSIPRLRHFILKTGIGEEFSRNLPGVPYRRVAPEKVKPIVEALIRSIRDIAASRGAQLLLMPIPAIEENPNKAIGYRGQVDWNEAFADNEKENNYLKSFARANGIQFLDLLQIIRAQHRKGLALYNINPDDHHWNSEGHRVAAEALYDWIKAYDWNRKK